VRTPKAIWMIRTRAGSYVKADPTLGFPYRSFRTKSDAMKWMETWPQPDAKLVKVRIRITEEL